MSRSGHHRLAAHRKYARGGSVEDAAPSADEMTESFEEESRYWNPPTYRRPAPEDAPGYREDDPRTFAPDYSKRKKG